MYVRYALLADAVVPGSGGKKNVIGTFDTIFAGQFPAAHGRFSLFVRLEAHVTEEGEHTAELELVDEDYNRLGQLPPVTFEMTRGGRPVPDAPLSAELVLEFDTIAFPKAGNYEFSIKVDGRHIGSVPVYVRPLPQPSQEPPQT